MSSPWTASTIPPISPFPIPSLAPTPGAFLGAAPSPNPLLAQALLSQSAPGSSSTPGWAMGLPSYTNSPNAPMIGSSPLAAFAATASTPFPGGGLGSTPAGIAGAGAAGGGTVGGGRTAEVSLEDAIRGIDQAKLVLLQLEALLLRRQQLEQQVFGQSNPTARATGEGAGEGMGMGMEVDGSAPDIPAESSMTPSQAQAALIQAQSEYTQLLGALSQLSTLSLFGGLPLPLSSASSDPGDPSKGVTMSDLTSWAEGRAALEFSRREAVKAGGKAVLEVMKLGGRA